MRQRSELHDALAAGDRERMEALLRDGADIEAQNRHGWTPLMAASLHGQVDFARLLLDSGADLHARNKEGKSAIHYAAMRGGPDAVRLLVRLGADVNTQDTFRGFAPLHLAAAHCNQEIVIDTCAALLASGAEVDARTTGGSTPLRSAAFAGRIDLVDFLLRHGADLDARDTHGQTILMFVVKMCMFPTMKEHLIARGADVNAQDAEGRTALMYAAERASHSTLDILINAGADVNMQDTHGRTALMYAAGEAPKVSTIGMLGREASTAPPGGNAPNGNPEKKAARLANAYHGRAEAVRRLRARRAVVEHQDTEGRTALDVALDNARTVEDDNAEVIAALREDANEEQS